MKLDRKCIGTNSRKFVLKLLKVAVRPASISEETINVNILHAFCIHNGFPDTQIMVIYYLTDCSFKMSSVLPRDLRRTYHYEFFLQAFLEKIQK